MPTVNLKYRRPDGLNVEGVALVEGDGVVEINSYRRYDTSTGEMTRIAFTAPIGASVLLAGGSWTFELVGVSNGKGGYLTGSDAKITRLVPNSGGPYDVDDLDEVEPSGTGLEPEWKAYIDLAVAGITGGTPGGTGPGGAFVIDDVSDASAVGQLVVKAADQAAGRAAIGAAAAANAVFTGTFTTADAAIAQAKISGLVAALALLAPKANATFTGTFATADNAIAQAKVNGLVADLAAINASLAAFTTPDWGDIIGTPNVAILDGSNKLPLANFPIYAVVRVGNGGVTVPIRPAYDGPIDFWCSTEPPRTGTTAGGTAAAAPGDGWLQAPT